MRALIFDPFAGISGDMVLGALVDLGLSEEWFRELVASLEVPGTVVVERAMRSGIACGRVRFELPHPQAGPGRKRVGSTRIDPGPAHAWNCEVLVA